MLTNNFKHLLKLYVCRTTYILEGLCVIARLNILVVLYVHDL
jgi:hypothetical protein